MIRIVKFILIVLVIIIGLAIHIRNDQPVALDLYIGVLELPFSLFLVISLCVGAMLGIMATLPSLLKLGREKSRLMSQIRLNEKELDTLRVIPLKE